MPTWITPAGDDCLVTVWVVPGSSKTEITGEHGDTLKVRVTAPPEGGRANTAVLELLRATTGRNAKLERAPTGRRKVVRLTGCTAEHAARLLTPRC